MADFAGWFNSEPKFHAEYNSSKHDLPAWIILKLVICLM